LTVPVSVLAAATVAGSDGHASRGSEPGGVALPTCPRLVYGPVPSRRLGRSLGVDVVPYKTCTYDCIYCQLGRTTRKTVERMPFESPEAVVEEVAAALAGGARPDIVTVSGSGEPTLYARLGAVIAGLRRLFRPVAVLTNGSLLSDPAVREDLLQADLVVPSLDAAGPATFSWVNRPHPALDYAEMVAGLAEFRRQYRGALWLEVMLLGGITGIRPEVGALATTIARIAPDRVHLNTVVRPPAESFAYPVPETELHCLAALFTPPAEVIAGGPVTAAAGAGEPSRDGVAELLRRRPCTVEDLAEVFGAAPAEVVKVLAVLLRDGSVEVRRSGGRLFYAALERWR
jgi:wyosine [tRNA(Phe)-imidazoG37] synthetase (radical SAM superfamily)